MKKIAVTYEDGNIFQHFGHTKQFKLFDIEDGKIKNTSILNNSGSGHGALADFLKNNGVDTLICGGIGNGAKVALADANITLFGGVSGSVDDAVNDLLSDKLNYNPDIKCNHHDENHNHDHNCGHHNNSGRCHD